MELLEGMCSTDLELLAGSCSTHTELMAGVCSTAMELMALTWNLWRGAVDLDPVKFRLDGCTLSLSEGGCAGLGREEGAKEGGEGEGGEKEEGEVDNGTLGRGYTTLPCDATR